jgi:hypothetical protein
VLEPLLVLLEAVQAMRAEDLHFHEECIGCQPLLAALDAAETTLRKAVDDR